MKLKQIKTVQQNLERGGWVTNLPNLPGVSVKVRGLFNSEATRVFAEARTSMSEDEFKDQAIQDALDLRIVTETVLLDWDGIEDDSAKPDKDGKLPPLTYSPELAHKILADPEYAVLRRAVNYAAGVVAQHGKETLEEAAKN